MVALRPPKSAKNYYFKNLNHDPRLAARNALSVVVSRAGLEPATHRSKLRFLQPFPAARWSSDSLRYANQLRTLLRSMIASKSIPEGKVPSVKCLSASREAEKASRTAG